MRKFALLFLILGLLGISTFVFALTFDYDLIPNFNNVFDIGFGPSPRWKNINIGGILYAGNRVTIGTTTPGDVLRVATSSEIFAVDASAKTKIGSHLAYFPVFSADPPHATSGAIYYLSSGANQKFRGFEGIVGSGGAWSDIIGQAAQLFWDDQGTQTWNANTGNVGIGLTTGITEKLTVNGVVEGILSQGKGGIILPDGKNLKIGRNSVFATSSNDAELVSGGYVNKGSFLAENAANWTQEFANGQAGSWSPRIQFTAAVFQNKIWVMGGVGCYNPPACTIFSIPSNDVWSSSDGKTWVQNPNAPWEVRRQHVSVTFNNKIWVIGGCIRGTENDCYDFSGVDMRSDFWTYDGVNWTQAVLNTQSLSRFKNAAAAVFQNKIWLAGADFGRFTCNPPDTCTYRYMFDSLARSSVDGISWSYSAPIGTTFRTDAALTVYDNKLWIMGGKGCNSVPGVYCADNEISRLNDVWYTIDGTSWTMTTNIAAWGRREGLQALGDYDFKMWVLGGFKDVGSSPQNDVWYSKDGLIWTSVISQAPWMRRLNHNALLFNNRMWVMGGDPIAGYFLNDVWSAAHKEIFLYNNF